MRLEADRIFLRPLKRKDKNQIVKGKGNIEISKWLLGIPNPFTERDAINWIKTSEKPGINAFGIICKEKGVLMGEAGLLDQQFRHAEVGYWLLPEYHGKGYASEAVKILLQEGKNRLNFHTYNATVCIENSFSRKLLERLGFQDLREENSYVCKADGELKIATVYRKRLK